MYSCIRIELYGLNYTYPVYPTNDANACIPFETRIRIENPLGKLFFEKPCMISTVVRITWEQFKIHTKCMCGGSTYFYCSAYDIQPNEVKEAKEAKGFHIHQTAIQHNFNIYFDTSEKDDEPWHTVQNAVEH